MDEILKEIEAQLSKEDPKFKRPLDRSEVFQYYMFYLITKSINELKQEIMALKPEVEVKEVKPLKNRDKIHLKEVE